MLTESARQTEDATRQFMAVRFFQKRYGRGHNLTILNSDLHLVTFLPRMRMPRQRWRVELPWRLPRLQARDKVRSCLRKMILYHAQA